MWGLHLKRRSKWWYYYRAVPKQYRDVEARSQICFSLKTSDFSKAKLRAAQISADLEEEWQKAVDLGISLSSRNEARRYEAATQCQLDRGLAPTNSNSMSNDELLMRLRMLLDRAASVPEQKALLGLVEVPQMSMMEGFERFWAHIEDEWSGLSHDQVRAKRNGYLKALSNFREAVGDVPLYQVERRHAMDFRTWWLKRLKKRGLKPHTGNKDINALRRLITTNYDIDAYQAVNPFARIKLKDEPQTPRIPFSSEQIKNAIKPGALGKLHPDFVLLFRLLVNTGMRPVEAIGLELSDIRLDHEVPHVHIRRNGIRGLKTDHSERLIPLLGASLDAAKELVDAGGWGKRAGKNMYATSLINQHLRENGIVTEKQQSLYSLRHWFQDQLTKQDVIDRAQAQLMGHKFHRPKYGYGKDLQELRDIIVRFAIEAP
ncbi:DUF6538 domain-containing protein [Cohaesibacter gelatinilyticus]|uniref:Site-specific recombinase XerD n=1 Tax=Cohaesibacter gelatinilyticus TaxID=372072 RepID=A0A285PE83_9HYPH|nr:DUF6538 domain-containing protein [Cohaesibacter gelatinilyticus]SNZ20064.1 Site-specific recombinase XerD [Cohaesibacter gelatinilyticus]